jgi:hypothetical protein
MSKLRTEDTPSKKKPEPKSRVEPEWGGPGQPKYHAGGQNQPQKPFKVPNWPQHVLDRLAYRAHITNWKKTRPGVDPEITRQIWPWPPPDNWREVVAINRANDEELNELGTKHYIPEKKWW